MLTEREKWLMEQAWRVSQEQTRNAFNDLPVFYEGFHDWLGTRVEGFGASAEEVLEYKAYRKYHVPAWTSEPPTEPGWYWWRRSELDRRPRPVFCNPRYKTVGQWLGPLEVP